MHIESINRQVIGLIVNVIDLTIGKHRVNNDRWLTRDRRANKWSTIGVGRGEEDTGLNAGNK